MKTELKDVIHFYMGCEAIADETRFKIHGVEFMDAGTFINSESTECWRLESCDFKLMLRPLSDISSDEKITIMSTEQFETSPISGRLGQKVSYGFTCNITEWNFKAVIYLIKQGFDVFNLIENGYAIDKTKIK